MVLVPSLSSRRRPRWPAGSLRQAIVVSGLAVRHDVRSCPMSPRPPLEDVARAAGVSRSAFSRVVNDQPGVTSPVRQRVWRVVRELGYRPDQVARALASGQADAIDVMDIVIV